MKSSAFGFLLACLHFDSFLVRVSFVCSELKGNPADFAFFLSLAHRYPLPSPWYGWHSLAPPWPWFSAQSQHQIDVINARVGDKTPQLGRLCYAASPSNLFPCWWLHLM